MNGWDLYALCCRDARRLWPLRLILQREDAHLRALAAIIKPPASYGLDLGCGTGRATAVLGPPHSLFGVDRTPAMALSSRRPILIADALCLPVRPEAVDLILCIGLSEYIENLDELLRQSATVCRAGAHLLMSSSPPSLFLTLRRLTGVRIHARRSERIRTSARRYSFRLLAERHCFSQDLFLFVKC